MGVSGEGGPTGQSLWVILNSWRGRRVDILVGVVRIRSLREGFVVEGAGLIGS